MKTTSHAPLLAALLLTGCAPAGPPTFGAEAVAPRPPEVPAPAPRVDEPTPELRLPSDTKPLAERLELTIDPTQTRFSGVVDIRARLDRPRDALWLHGLGLNVTKATVTPAGGATVPATWAEKHRSGIAQLALATSVPAGEVIIHIEYDAPFGTKLEGLYKTSQAGVAYASTQFESIAARLAFPCFDEPAFKIPFDTTLIVPAGAQAISNSKEVERAPQGTGMRVHFAPTLPLPSYLVAFAVGPFDVIAAPDVPPNAVRKRPLPLRGVTAKGRGKEIAYALSHTGEIVAILEAYFGIEYPYDKLDILAIPDKGGAMENAGAITFQEYLLLMDEKSAPINQKRSYARVMAHELAHQWVGDLVTAEFWDDIWLNEAFATWVAAKATDTWDPRTESSLNLLSGIQQAIGTDGLVNARAVRQPIKTTDDIENAFDSITYQKGGGVLGMFERYLHLDVFQRGVHDYLSAHAFGAATADDFLDAMSKAAGRDVKTPFRTFLDQPGVPFLQAETRCDGKPRLHLRQSRYLPMGSKGDADKVWQIPVCARFQAKGQTREECTLLTEKEGDLALGDVCPDWVFPNADAAGYLRFGLAPQDLEKLRTKGYASLSTRERVAYGNSLRAALNRGALPFVDVLRASEPLAQDGHREIAGEPMSLVGLARDWLYDEPQRARVEAYGARLFQAQGKKLGWDRRKTDDEETVSLRASVLGFLTRVARDTTVRGEAKKRALAYLGFGKDDKLHPELVDQNLISLALEVAGEDADRPLFDAMRAAVAKTDDERVRNQLLWALSSARSPGVSKQVLPLIFDPSLRVVEATIPLRAQLQSRETRDQAWAFLREHFDEIVARVSAHHGKTQLIEVADAFCDEGHAKEVEDFFTPRMASIDGGPRVLASVLEDIRLCDVKRKALSGGARDFFAGK